MAKTSSFDLTSLTAAPAVPMPKLVEEVAATAPAAPRMAVAKPTVARRPAKIEPTPTANLEPLQFKVSPEFSQRFRQAAFDRRLKLNELLFQVFDTWERQQKKG